MVIKRNNITKICDFNILYLNICSIRKKLFELEALINELKTIDIIVLTEVWIYDNEIDTYNLPNYTAIYNCRNNNRGG